MVRVLESRLLPPYEAAGGLGPSNAPGLARLAGASFRGEYPLATVSFRDNKLPVKVTLEAFTPIFPLDADESGLPVAILRYKVSNPGPVAAEVGIVFSLENPVEVDATTTRVNERRSSGELEGLLMRADNLPAGDGMNGSVALGVLPQGGKLTLQRGWTKAKWWADAPIFWEDFSSDGELEPESPEMGRTGCIAVKRTIAPGAQAEFTYVLAWHFPNRMPEVNGWSAGDKAHARDIIGNHYATRFANAWEAADYAVKNLPRLVKGGCGSSWTPCGPPRCRPR